MNEYPVRLRRGSLFIPVVLMVVLQLKVYAGVCAELAVLCVPTEYASVQSAIDAAQGANSIQIAQGTYYENLNITGGGNLSIEGGWNFSTNEHSNDPALTIIDGNQTGRVFYIDPDIADLNLTIKDLTIQNGKKTDTDGLPGQNYGAGIYAGNFSSNFNQINMTLINNIITGNQVLGNYSDGGAVAVVAQYNNVEVTMRNNEINGNHADYDGGGMLFRVYGWYRNFTVTMENNYIHDNTSRFASGMFFYNDGNDNKLYISLVNNTISNNMVDGCFVQDNDFGGPAYGGGIGIVTNGQNSTSGGQLFTIDDGGNTQQISPHDPETGEWIFYSRNVKTGRVVRVEMEKLVKAIEKLTGETFMIESIEE